MTKIRRLDEIYINFETVCKAILLIFICTLYAFNEQSIYAEAAYILVFSLYFISRRKRLTVYALWNLLFVGICTLSVLWSYSPDDSINMARKLLELAIIGNLLIAFIDNKEKLIFLYKTFVFAGLVLIIRLVISTPVNAWGSERLGEGILNANSIGLYLTLSAICAIQLAIHKRNIIYFLLPLAFFLIIVLTGSRKAFAMVLMGCLGLYYINSRKISKKVVSVFLISIIVIIGYTLVMNIPVFYDILGVRLERMINTIIGEGQTDNSTEVRFNMIEIGINLLIDRPILGHGISTYNTLTGLYYAHNNYIELLVGVGAIGTIIYYSIYVYVIIRLFSMRKNNYTNALLIIVLSLAVIEYGLVSYYSEVYQLLIAASIAAIKVRKTESFRCELE